MSGMSKKAASTTPDPNSPPRPAAEKTKEGQFDARKEAYQLAGEGTTFHDSFGVSYITFNHKSEGGVTYSVDSKEFSREFRRMFHREHKRPLNVDVFETVRAQLLAEAGSKCHEVWLRVAVAGDTVYLDLCNAAREVLEISPRGLKYNSLPPINFTRPATTKALPKPRAMRCMLRFCWQRFFRSSANVNC